MVHSIHSSLAVKPVYWIYDILIDGELICLVSTLQVLQFASIIKHKTVCAYVCLCYF